MLGGPDFPQDSRRRMCEAHEIGQKPKRFMTVHPVLHSDVNLMT